MMIMRSFNGLAPFYHRFIKDFSSIMAPLIKCVKKGNFEWTKASQRAFEVIKSKPYSAPILALPNLKHFFDVKYDASGFRNGATLTQAKWPLTNFSEKLMAWNSKTSLMTRSFMISFGLLRIGVTTLSLSPLWDIRITRPCFWYMNRPSSIPGIWSGWNFSNHFPSLASTWIARKLWWPMHSQEDTLSSIHTNPKSFDFSLYKEDRDFLEIVGNPKDHDSYLTNGFLFK